MRRTRCLALLSLTLVLAMTPSASHAVDFANRINGIGMVDYAAGRPDFKVGSWVKYHVTGKSELGVVDDYIVTVLIAGEEEFWGDPGFWVETWTDAKGFVTTTAATLMSYSIFRDSLALPHLQTYMRKTVTGLKEDGSIDENVYERVEESLKSRNPVGGQIQWDLVPLGDDSVATAKGTFTVHKLRMDQGTASTGQSRDSSQYTEVREQRTMYLTPKIPITHTALEEIDYFMKRRTWLTGRSQDSGPLNMMDRNLGRAELVDFGHGGLKSRMLPVERQRSIAEQKAATRPAARPASTKPAGTKASATRKKAG